MLVVCDRTRPEQSEIVAWLKPVSVAFSDRVKVPFELFFLLLLQLRHLSCGLRFCLTGAMPSSSNSGTDIEESGLDTCPICLQDVGQEEAFLDNCYHRFHWRVSFPALLVMNKLQTPGLTVSTLQCVSSWTEVQKSHPSPSAAPLSCPLCKAPYASILHTFRDNTFRYGSA